MHEPPVLLADVTPATDQAPPSDSRIGPPESPEQTPLPVDETSVSRRKAPTFERTVAAARRIVPSANWSLPHPAMTAVSLTRASRLNNSGTTGPFRSSAVITTPTSSAEKAFAL